MPMCLKVIGIVFAVGVAIAFAGLVAVLVVRRLTRGPKGERVCYVCKCDVSDRRRVGRSFTDTERIVYLCRNCAAFDDQFADCY